MWGAVARRWEGCRLGRWVGVSCVWLGRLRVLAGRVSGKPCVLERLVGQDWLGERSPPVCGVCGWACVGGVVGGFWVLFVVA